MRIIFSPSYQGASFLNLGSNNLAYDVQVTDTLGFLTQLALHAGIHQETSPYPIRLANYYNAIREYDSTYPDNIFHRSFAIDGMSVAKTLLAWRDILALAGWNSLSSITGSKRLEDLLQIDSLYQDDGPSVLLSKVSDAVTQMCKGTLSVPLSYKALDIDVACPKDYLPDYLLPLFSCLETLVHHINYGVVDTNSMPAKMQVIEFSDQYKAEAWLSQQPDSAYDVWINTNNKRLDNWLHMSGKSVSGSEMLQSNPQILQMFLIAIQLFQRPLNINTLLQYLYLPECPLPWTLTSRLASTIVREGGFCSEKVLKCINDYLDRELKRDDDTPCELTAEERAHFYRTYLPFDLRKQEDTSRLSEESDNIDVKALTTFLKSLKSYAGNRAVKISSVQPHDLRIAQLREVVNLIDAILNIISENNSNLTFTLLQQCAKSLYETSNFLQYNAQTGSRFVIGNPSNIVSKADNTIWCDFYGDISSALSTDFLSPYEQDILKKVGVRLWNPDSETAYQNYMLESPLHQTTQCLTFVVCKRQGATELPTHPLRLQLPADISVINGDELFTALPSTSVIHVDNHRPEDSVEVKFDTEKHPISWRSQESYSALKDLLQNPLDYVMNYILGFSDKGPTEIKMALTRGNVAHEVIETLFMAERDRTKLKAYVSQSYDNAFNQALVRKGALLMLPENHLECDKLKHQLQRCVNQLAEVIVANKLTVKECEQEEVQSLNFPDGIAIKGYIDMRLSDANGNDVIFDLKWTSKKEQYQKLIEKNRATQLALYQAMLLQHDDHPQAARTAFFVMPAGKIISSDEFQPVHFENISPMDTSDLLSQLQQGYSVRRELISSGHIETAELMPVADLDYGKAPGVYPLEQKGKRTVGPDGKNVTIQVKVENEYSDYKCFTI